LIYQTLFWKFSLNVLCSSDFMLLFTLSCKYLQFLFNFNLIFYPQLRIPVQHERISFCRYNFNFLPPPPLLQTYDSEPYNKAGTANASSNVNWVSLVAFYFNVRFIVPHIHCYFAVLFIMSLSLLQKMSCEKCL
jgi:hypothetical protein